MKLVLIVVSSHNADNLTTALTGAGHRVTVAATAGGFLQRSNASIFTLVQDDQVDEVVEIVERSSKSVPDSRFYRGGLGTRNLGRATLFVVDVENFESIPGLPLQ